ncbi:hypothetical protein G9A89_011329 [Geosiphon pyriformis]|nr:hypothetical protein G9A89_011329 [Geosiphon pyriformis]
MSSTGAKKRSFRVPTSGSVSSSSSHKVKKPPGGAKLSSKDVALEGNGSGQVVEQFNSIDTDGEASKGEKVSNSKMNTPQAKRFNNGVIVGSPFSFINFDIEEEEEVLFPPHKFFSLEKVWMDPKIVKTQMEVAVKKSFILDINLSAVKEKLAMTKTQKQGVHSDRAVVIKKIPMDMPKEMIVTTVSEYGQIVSIKVQLIGLWQKAVVEFAKSSQANQLAAKWSFLIGKDSVHMAKAVKNRETWASRDQYRALLFTLPVGTTAYDLGNLLARAICCAVVCFENDKDLESVFCTESVFGGVKLSWIRLDLVWCERCGKLGHSVLKCDAEILHSPKLSKSFKKVCVPISRPAAFGGKSWAQVVFLASSSNGLYFGSGPGFGFSLGITGLVGHSFLTGPVGSILETRLASLEHSLELFTNKVSDIINKLNSLCLVLLALASSSQPLVAPGSVDMKFGSDMVLDEPDSVIVPSFSVFSGASSLGLNSSKILTSKVGCLELKLVALKALVCSVLKKLDQMYAGSDSAVSFAPQ